MEEVQEQKKFICKFCSKTCLSGKSLGGHMRCHLALISAAKKKKNKVKAKKINSFSNMDSDDHGIEEENSKNSFKISAAEQSSSSTSLIQEINLGGSELDQESYELRENPRKSWRVSDFRTNGVPNKGNLCKECGKKFSSSRALAGHMRTHSKKGIHKNQHVCKKCSKGFDSMRALYGHMKCHSKRSANGLSSEFDIDCPRKKRSVTRYELTSNLSFSSANPSLLEVNNEVEEIESVAVCLMMLSRGVRNWDEFNSTDNAVELKPFLVQNSKLDAEDEEENSMEKRDFSCILGSLNSVSDQGFSDINEFDSEFAKNDELEVSVDGVPPLGEMFKKHKRVIDPTQVEELAKDHDLLFEGKSSEMLSFDDNVSEIFKNSSKKREYKCKICDKVFPTHQALRGHSNRHKIISSSNEYKSTETKKKNDVMAMTSCHECPLCFKVFSRGQALGGHMRTHSAAFKGKATENHDIENNFDVGLKLWWAGNGQEREPLVDLISN